MPDALPAESFPPFRFAVHPVSRIPNWGAMRTPAEWERTYEEMTDEDFVPVPSYNLDVLTTPLSTLTNPITTQTIPLITAKLYYSTHYFSSYDIDAAEFTPEVVHPGIDLKLPEGTPVRAIGGGLVHAVRTTRRLGMHVILEHRVPGEGTFYSVYGHLAEATVKEGERVSPGETIGTVGMTGNTTGAHIHLQIDRGTGEAVHLPYYPRSAPSPAEAVRWTVHPITFIQEHQRTAKVVLQQGKKR